VSSTDRYSIQGTKCTKNITFLLIKLISIFDNKMHIQTHKDLLLSVSADIMNLINYPCYYHVNFVVS
jgi:hypothetical protein